MRYVIALVFALYVAGAGTAEADGLTGVLDRQDLDRRLQQSETRREIDAQRRDLQRQLDANLQLKLFQLQRSPACTILGGAVVCN